MKYEFVLIWILLAVTLIVPLLIFVRYNVNKTYELSKEYTGVVVLKPEEIVGKIITRDLYGWKILTNETCKRQSDFVLTRIMPVNTAIFVYPPERDIHISRMIINAGSWEYDLVNKMVLVMKRYPDAVFIDIGANIGIYSITMAALGFRVIAVDCFIENIRRICASSIHSNLTDNLSIIHNGLSNKRTGLKLIKSTEPNVGGMGVEQISFPPVTKTNISYVNAILLDDLLEMFLIKTAVLKMDVEKHEEKVLKGASNFFKNVRVESVLLEFRFHTHKKSGQFIIDFLDKHGLEPVLPNSIKHSKYSKWPGDIMWQRKNEEKTTSTLH